MFRRRPKLTPQDKADRKWERMASQPRTMGMVGIFNDLNPGAKHAEAQIIQQRETFADQASADGKTTRGIADVVNPRLPAGSGKGSATVTLTPNPQTPTSPPATPKAAASPPPKPEAD